MYIKYVFKLHITIKIVRVYINVHILCQEKCCLNPKLSIRTMKIKISAKLCQSFNSEGLNF